MTTGHAGTHGPRDAGPFVLQTRSMSALPVADQVRELQAALSLNKSELARILRVSRPTVYDWLGGGEPNADNRSRIRTLLRLVVQSRVSATDPLFPRFVKSALDPGDGILLDLLSEETIDEASASQEPNSKGEGVGGRDRANVKCLSRCCR